MHTAIKTHTPTRAQFQTVIDTLKTVLPMAPLEDNFNMYQGGVTDSEGHICGTAHCIGGWYAIAKNLHRDQTVSVDFLDGADAMARDLGFSDSYSYREWAHANEDLWGNWRGFDVFCSPRAYNNASTLAEAIAHMEGVRDRLPE